MAVEYALREKVAFEYDAGQRIDYDGLGVIPTVGEEIPNFTTLTLVDRSKFGFGDHISSWEQLSKGVIILHPLNGLATPICKIGAKECQGLLQQLPGGVSLYIVTSEHPDKVVDLIDEQDLKVPVLSSYQSNFGKQFGIWLQNHENPEDLETRGILQRSLFVVSKSRYRSWGIKLLHFQVEEDQGGPQPNFTEAIRIARTAA